MAARIRSFQSMWLLHPTHTFSSTLGHTVEPPMMIPPCLRRDCEGRGCLHYAASYGHDSCVEVLLGHAKCDPKSPDGHGDVALHFAAIHGHPMCAYHLARVSFVISLQTSRSQCRLFLREPVLLPFASSFAAAVIYWLVQSDVTPLDPHQSVRLHVFFLGMSHHRQDDREISCCMTHVCG